MTYKQFSWLIDILQKDIDQAELIGALGDVDDDDESSKGITSSMKGGVVMPVSNSSDDYDEYGSIDEDGHTSVEYMSVDEEEELKSIYDELRGTSDTLPLVEFLKWEDVQELLEIGAVSKDSLAECIEKVGVTVENGNLFREQFSDLIDLLDALVDQSKLVGEGADVDLDNLDGASFDDDDNDTRLLLSPDGEDNAGTQLDSSLDLLLSEDSEQEAQEVREMFDDLARGSEEISQKQLRKWDELQELVDAGLTSKSTIDSYIDKLDLAEGASLTFTKFKEFISYLDRALLDEDGDIFDDGTGLEGDT